ncbi:chemotaxis protein CheY [Pseudomonas aeruginosa VRFPA01]|nr:chemotaxis protein CheY [Pseudomonas aeruginosa VRFPA01]
MESMLDRSEQELVLVVDDTPDNLLLMRELLEERYRVRTADSGTAGLRPDLILLDVSMPGMDGYEVCQRLKADPLTRDIPLMFLTARAEQADEQRGLALGAVDYLSKPVSPPIVLARVRTHLQLKATADFLRDKSEYLELEVRRRTRQLQQLQDVTIEALATLGDLRDNPRSRHLPRIERYVRLLAERLATQAAFADALTPEAVGLLSKSALLHDIGKVAVPDRVLLNPGQLDAADTALLQAHTRVGRDALADAERRLGQPSGFLRFARQIAYSHHERWDGRGFPEGLAGERIPLAARIVAIADRYDELTSRHAYRTPLAHAEAVLLIQAGAGSEFDPRLVKAFVAVADAFAEVARRYADSAEALDVEVQRLEQVAESIEITAPPPA